MMKEPQFLLFMVMLAQAKVLFSLHYSIKFKKRAVFNLAN
ncbi:hypothetical protein HMPREF0493_0167 [Lactobacillus amylolyticus DSM 11664]|uniref:Uncharacterized protein n=1 Tax=Lactobacillus amylolyticus DSM 11664 TaxID=585524 RepID=D4YRN9_9LACO|nr:hypothetical protein HMPREF0493_0167 [Lactobacillus amylolyticus DSM 11664]